MNFYKIGLTSIFAGVICLTLPANAGHRKVTISHIEQIEHTRLCYVHYTNGVKLEKDCERAIKEYNRQTEQRDRERRRIHREHIRECKDRRGQLGRIIGDAVSDNHKAGRTGESLAERSCY